ncbi:hypothetical protein RRG08_044303 [Elysia crispata]|uniref:Uncharacterized protein n=1 Tax=Elysia crispata TaxID=231223 RepID=A0AAE1CP46_9GAST|nr:hypothetical protein RRG08_044303 [Elysia crispata]
MGRQDDTEKKIENWLGGGREEFKLRKDRRREAADTSVRPQLTHSTRHSIIPHGGPRSRSNPTAQTPAPLRRAT